MRRLTLAAKYATIMQLYLNSYGAYLHVKDALFEVRAPQSDAPPQKRHFAAHKVTSIILTTSAALSTDAIQLALRHNIDIVKHDSIKISSEVFTKGSFWFRTNTLTVSPPLTPNDQSFRSGGYPKN